MVDKPLPKGIAERMEPPGPMIGTPKKVSDWWDTLSRESREKITPSGRKIDAIRELKLRRVSVE